METYIAILVLVPLVGFVISLMIPTKSEANISRTALTTSGMHFIFSVFFFVFWIYHQTPSVNIKEFVVYAAEGYEFFIDLYFDKVTAVFLLVGSSLTYLIIRYSKSYMHREEGYKRFFNTILFFYFGYVLIIFSGNFETLFIGWEILGVASFLLISFYRERYLPVRNAMRVFTVYRMGDIGLILAMWLSHHLWGANVTFQHFNQTEVVDFHLLQHSLTGLFASLMIVFAATAKSAQFPFTFWLPRAMEGPTPSSAIFYGSLSVHIGAFVLLRTFPFWEHLFWVKFVVVVIGLITAIISAATSMAQPSVKAQIAYSSAAQIGIIFIEIALGFETLALIHFAGNAFLRTYQLLISPSIVSYLIRDQLYHFKASSKVPKFQITKRISDTIFILSLKEWSLDSLSFYFLWRPFKILGNRLKFLTPKLALYVLLPIFIAGCILLFFQEEIHPQLRLLLPLFFGIIGLILSIKSFVKRHDARFSWLLVFQNHLWIALAITFNEHFEYSDMFVYLSGILVSFAVGYFVLHRLIKHEVKVDLNKFQGYSQKYRGKAFVFLLACLGMSGFPITPTFVGEDLIFSHIEVFQIPLVVLVSLSFIINGIVLIRMYSRIFLGPLAGSDKPLAGRAS